MQRLRLIFLSLSSALWFRRHKVRTPDMTMLKRDLFFGTFTFMCCRIHLWVLPYLSAFPLFSCINSGTARMIFMKLCRQIPVVVKIVHQLRVLYVRIKMRFCTNYLRRNTSCSCAVAWWLLDDDVITKPAACHTLHPCKGHCVRKQWYHWCQSHGSEVKFWRTHQRCYSRRAFFLLVLC
jgi:hypothetical protein